MKKIELMVEIDEAIYNDTKNGFYWDNENIREMAIAIVNGIPLENIKEEINHDIKNLPSYMKYLYDDELYGYKQGLAHALYIIYKHTKGVMSEEDWFMANSKKLFSKEDS